MPSRSDTSRRQFLIGSAAAGSLLALDPAKANMLPGGLSARIEDAVSLSIANTLREGLTDIPWLPRPFELDLLTQDKAMRHAVALHAMDIISAGKFEAAQFSPVEQVMIPKRNYATRRHCAVVEPMDAVAYLALALLAAPAIEAARIPRNEGIVYSYRFAPKQGRVFDSASDIRAFLRASRTRSEAGNIVAACDIGNFYAYIPPSAVAHALANTHVEPWLRDYVVALLEFWNANGAAGLPTGSNSSRILAEAVLIPVDRALVAARIPFSRYVDDFRFFVKDTDEAAHAIALTGALLEREGLYLNHDKTRIWFPESANVAPETVAYERERLLHRVGQAGPGGPDPRVPLPNPLDRNDPSYPDYPRLPGPDPRDAYPYGPQFPDRPGPNDPPYPPYLGDPNGRDDGLPLPPRPRRVRPRTRYSGLVPRYARRPSEKELQQLRTAEAPDATRLLDGELAHTEDVRTAMRQAIFGGHAEFAAALPKLLVCYPEFTCYAVSALTKGAERLPAETRDALGKDLATLLFDAKTETFLKPKLLELISHPGYVQRGEIERYARSIREPKGVRFRAALDALRRTGGIPAPFRTLYAQADGWGRRALLADGANMFDPVTDDVFAAQLARTV